MTANVLAVAVIATQQVTGTEPPVRPDVVMTVQSAAPLFRGSPVRVLVRTSHEAFLTLYRVDTEGRIAVLYPSAPDSQRAWAPMVSRGIIDRAGQFEDRTFTVDDYPGTGYLFVIASPTPFDYAAMRDSSGWNVAGLIDGGRVTDDADAMITDIAVATLPDTIPFAYDEQRYLVGVTLPPIVGLPCVDCNPVTGQPSLIPIREWCATFRPEGYRDPWNTHPGQSIPVSVAAVAPRYGPAPPSVHPSGMVASPRRQTGARERKARERLRGVAEVFGLTPDKEKKVATPRATPAPRPARAPVVGHRPTPQVRPASVVRTGRTTNTPNRRRQR